MRHRSETPIQYQRDLLDTWLSAGNTRHRQIRAFTTWLARSHVTGPLTVSYAPRATMAPLADDDRCALLERLLHDDAIQPGDRLAGTLVVLYGQPFTRIAALHASDIHTTPRRPRSRSAAAPSHSPNRSTP